jgi:hypothetical protein
VARARRHSSFRLSPTVIVTVTPIMSDADSAPTATAYAACLAVLLGMAGALYLTFTEPFAGTAPAFAGRVLGPIAVMLMALSLVLRRRRRGVALLLGSALGATVLVLVIAG